MESRAPFVYESLPMRVRFGAGMVREVGDELDRLGVLRALVLSTPGHAGLADSVADLLGDRCAGVCAEAVMHVPVEVARAATRRAVDVRADGCVAVGGGSTVGLGKAVALELGLPVVAVPTTYAGSEMTPVWGLTEGGVKRTGRDAAVLPRSVVYDPDLTHTLSPELSVTSGMNAMAHAVEALYAPDGSPVTSLWALEAVRAFAAALPAVVADPLDAAARSTALCGAWLAGACLGATTMSLHHRLCHALGGTLDLPHAELHTVLLPYVLAFNASAVPAVVSALASALAGSDPVAALRRLGGLVELPDSLQAMGVRREDLGPVTDQVLASPYSNPAPVTAEALRGLLLAAWAGTEPTST